MPEASLVPKFLKAVAEENGFDVHDCLYGSISLGRHYPVEQSCGAVYGIWAQSPSALKVGLQPLPGYTDWYPVYWGKDISPVSRLKAHVQNHAATGNVNLPGIVELQELPLVYGAILVSRYGEFEKLLHARFPPMRGTGRMGKQGSIVRVRA